MKNKVFSDWNFMRALRLLLGVAVIIQAFVVRDIMIAVAGFLVAGMAVFNIGCCGTGNCNIPKKNTESKKEITYEEVV